ncbi:hypothetical protein GUJ93_ZPchr0003g17196 [Zizania palustris]|uniref:Uncharacterized protein n=1 Tax=Zizania palustris TaxID=103762 RepID=A0A8J5SA69_ZIZPA|nr:hypothetical protein GUJ93_ZPchr0003g17196 [Zizania palustris]
MPTPTASSTGSSPLCSAGASSIHPSAAAPPEATPIAPPPVTAPHAPWRASATPSSALQRAPDAPPGSGVQATSGHAPRCPSGADGGVAKRA